MHRRVSVTFCVYDKPDIVGGPYSWIKWLLPALSKRGIDVRCFVLLHTGEKGPVSRALEENGLECTFTTAHHYTEDRVRWILQQFRNRPSDVFVPNEVPAAYHAVRWIRKTGAPTVGIIHTDGAETDAFIQLFIKGPRESALSSVVCVSQALEGKVRAVHPGSTSVHRIPYGAQVPSEFASFKTDSFSIVYAGRLAEEQKQVSALAEAFCRAAFEVPDVTASIYGDGPRRAEMLDILERRGGGRVSWGGRLESDHMQSRLAGHQAVVLLSDYEGLPIVLLEAMSCGLVPICLYNESGIPELVTDGETGLIVHDRGDAFVEAVRRLRSDRRLWERLSLNARLKIEAHYSHGATTDHWVSLLTQAADGAPTRVEQRVPRSIRLADPLEPYESSWSRKPQIPLQRRAYTWARRFLGRVRLAMAKLGTGASRS